MGLQLFVICSALAVDNGRWNTGRDGPKFIYNGIRKAAIGYDSLKDKQVEAVSTFMKGNDIFVSLPGYWFRKSICIIFTLCRSPYAFDSTDTTLSRDKAAHVMYYGYHDRC